MTPRNPDDRVTPSVLDRIIDSGRTGEIGETPSDSIAGMKQSLFRDLAALLNTKRPSEEIPEEFPEARSSLMTYGLPDFTNYGSSDAENLREAIAEAVQTFEPRLTRVSVSYKEPDKPGGPLVFRVEALLRVEPAPEPIQFDTVLQRETKRIEVEGVDT